MLSTALIAMIASVTVWRLFDSAPPTEPLAARPAVHAPRPVVALASDMRREAAQPSARIEVIDADGRAVPGAALWAGAPSARDTHNPPIAIGDDNGVIQFDAHAIGAEDRSWIWRHGFVPEQWRGQVQVVLMRGESQVLRVVDWNGRARPDEVLWLSRRNVATAAEPDAASRATGGADVLPVPTPSEGTIFWARTDASGVATPGGLAAGVYQVGMRHPDLRVVSLRGGLAGGGLRVPGPPVEVVVDECTGVRVELIGDRIISRAYLSPHGVRLKHREGELDNGRGDWIEFEGARVSAATNRDVSIFLDLTTSGPVRLDLTLRGKTSPEYTVRRQADGDREAAKATFVVTDSSGRRMNVPVRCTGVVGTPLSALRRGETRAIAAGDLRWGARGRSNEVMHLGPRTYIVDIPTPFLVDLVEPRTVTFAPGESKTVELSCNEPCQQVLFRYPHAGTPWTLTIVREDGSDAPIDGTFQFSDTSMHEAWLPRGSYRFGAFAAGFRPKRSHLRLTNADVVHDFPE
ncbi:MAG: hypothetical protein KAI24_08005 [Planctomycetes bacterium]|nr:hypothetical protein [Planctomycetota bacterium]